MPDKFDPKHQRSDTNQRAAEIAELEKSKEELQRVNNELREKVVSLEQATEVLREREAGYRELVQNTNSAIIRWKSDGTITFFNEYAQSFFGYDAGEILGKHAKILVPDFDSTGSDLRTIAQDIVARPEKYIRNVNENICRDGRRVWMAWTNKPVFDEDGKVAEILAVGTDFSEHKRIEEALRESEEKFHSAFANAAIGFAMTNPDGSFLDANPAYCALTGYSIHELRSIEFRQLIHPDDFERNVKQVRQMLDGQIPDFTIESRYIRKGGETVWVQKSLSLVRNADGNSKWIIALIQDITKRKRAEEALCQSQEDFGRAQEVGQIGWWRLDTQRNVLTWSDESYRIFGVPIGTPMSYEDFLQSVYPDDLGYVDAQWSASLRGAPYDIEHRILAAGRVKWVREKAYLEMDNAGNLLGGFGIVQDITERKQAEQLIRQLNETLEQRVAERTAEVRKKADQLRALASQLSQAELRERKRLANILHDHIQQLIVAARMQVNWLKRDSDAERIHATAQGVDAILREALEASRSLTVDLSPPALHESGLTGGLNWLAARMLEKNRLTVNLRADNKAEPATEEVRFLLFECVRELLFNVVKHAEASEAHVTLLRTSDAHIKLIVSDHGKGFDPSVIRKRRSGETTFGLFSIQERLAHIGGRMNVESTPGKGVKVTLWVPAGEAAVNLGWAAEKSRQRSASSAENRLFNKHQLCRILIVDDHKIVREGLSGLLQLESGIEVVGEAADGPQAIELARTLKPDVIIMDVNLGKMTGVEATRKILADCPKIKVIGLSMNMNTQIAVAMREAGAIAYLTKGGPSEDLIAAIHACAPPQSPAPE